VFKTALTYAESVVLVAAVSVAVQYLAELDWPWAIVIGAAASIALRWLIQSWNGVRRGNPRMSGGR
jgi:hypothetical protein